MDVAEVLTAGLPALRAEARREGFHFLDRLASDWEAGAVCFDRPGEVLLAAYAADVLAGVGGLTLDPIVPGALGMRRFYVHPASGTAGAPVFWEALGFVADRCEGHTHVRRAPWGETDCKFGAVGRGC